MKLSHISKKVVSFIVSAVVVSSSLAISVPQTAHAAATNATVSYQLADQIGDGNILHCFDWTYQQIIDELPNIAKAGFTSVQTSPAQEACVGSNIWYYLYQPNNFYVGSSGLGNESDLKRLCQEADRYGVKVIVDVVANHLAGDHTNIDWELKDRSNWHNESGSIDYQNRYQITHRDIGMPDINSENYFVQTKVKNYIQQLKADGVDGIRWDAAKHISLPSENCSFWSTVIDRDLFHYGEILDKPVNGNDDFANRLMSEYTDYMSITDSGYGNTVLGALNGGKVPTSFGNLCTVSGIENNEIVYWGESHDTYANDTNEGGWTKYINQNTVDRAYAIVASRNGARALYFSRPYQTDKRAIMVGQKGSTHFTSDEVAAVNHFHNVCIGEADYYTTKDNVAVITRKSGAVLVLGSGNNRKVSVPNGGGYTEPGTYIDEISGNTFTVTKDQITGTIGSTGIAVFYKISDPVPPTPPVDPEDPVEERSIYLDTNACSWFEADSAVAAIKVGGASAYTKMTVTTLDGKTVYTAKVPANATQASIVRMLPSGKYYNEKTIQLSSDVNTYRSDENWSTITSTWTQIGSDEPIDEPTDPIVVPGKTTIYFSNNCNWNQVFVYSWGGANTVSWPGTEMSYVKNNEYGQAVYQIQLDQDIKGFLFTNGKGQQTVDIEGGVTEGTGYYIQNTSGKYSVGTYQFQ